MYKLEPVATKSPEVPTYLMKPYNRH